MNTKAKIGLVVLAALLLSTLSGCILIDANSIKGDWSLKNSTGTYNFDGAGLLTYTSESGLTNATCNYSISGNTLTISNGSFLTFLDGPYTVSTPSATQMTWKTLLITYEFTKK